ncbi:MAG: motility associated factor glycosyltransferase family protein [Arcobacteraceae bacterium]|nr:motility associated factor glycosyltransferase family protein [Arcobacteraceae bacterium]
METLEEIQQTIQEIFLKNLNFFKQHHIYLYNQLMEFEKNIQENYFIDFIDNHFELLDKDNIPTYNCDPFYDAKYRVENLHKNISGISTIDTVSREILSDEIYESNKFINEFINLFAGQEIETNVKFKKFIFIGTLLGVHINDIANANDLEVILIVEDNIEIFRLSMFLTDYKTVANKSKIFFAINSNEAELYNTIFQYLKFKNEYNYFLKFEIASQKEIPLLHQISRIISSQSKTIYSYSKFLEAYSNGIDNFTNTKRLINLSKQFNEFEKVPVLFLGGGPSLEDNIDFVKNNQDKFLIVVVMASLKRLEKANIIPDIILTIDSHIKLLEFIDVDKKYYQNSIIFASMNTHPQVIDKLSISKDLYLFQSNTEIFYNHGNFTGATVGDIGVKLLLKLGVTSLYLLGIDAAFNQITGATHDLTHAYSTIQKLETTEDENIDFGKQTFKVVGNQKEAVYTTGSYKLTIDSFNDIKELLNHNIKIYNLSNHGALLNGTIPTTCKEVNLTITIDKKIFLKEFINNISKYITTQKPQHSIAKQIIQQYEELINPYYFYLLNNHKNVKKKQLDKIKNNQLNIITKQLKSISNNI